MTTKHYILQMDLTTEELRIAAKVLGDLDHNRGFDNSWTARDLRELISIKQQAEAEDAHRRARLHEVLRSSLGEDDPHVLDRAVDEILATFEVSGG